MNLSQKWLKALIERTGGMDIIKRNVMFAENRVHDCHDPMPDTHLTVSQFFKIVLARKPLAYIAYKERAVRVTKLYNYLLKRVNTGQATIPVVVGDDV